MTVPETWTDSTTKQTLSFCDDGMFRDSSGQGPQKGFKLSGDFSDWLHSYVQARLVSQEGLVKTEIDGVPIFHTANAFNKASKLLVLTCGSGRIHAGLWSVGVCAYSGLNAGSVLPCIEKARERGMEVVILNPNYSMSGHAENCFNKLIIPSEPERVWIIAHSAGGYSTCSVVNHNPEWAIKHIMAVGLTDACETKMSNAKFDLNKWSHLKMIDWIQSNEPVNTPLGKGLAAQLRSAETTDHPLTTYKALNYIWEFFDENGANADQSPPLDEDFTLK